MADLLLRLEQTPRILSALARRADTPAFAFDWLASDRAAELMDFGLARLAAGLAGRRPRSTLPAPLIEFIPPPRTAPNFAAGGMAQFAFYQEKAKEIGLRWRAVAVAASLGASTPAGGGAEPRAKSL